MGPDNSRNKASNEWLDLIYLNMFNVSKSLFEWFNCMQGRRKKNFRGGGDTENTRPKNSTIKPTSTLSVPCIKIAVDAHNYMQFLLSINVTCKKLKRAKTNTILITFFLIVPFIYSL